MIRRLVSFSRSSRVTGMTVLGVIVSIAAIAVVAVLVFGSPKGVSATGSLSGQVLDTAGNPMTQAVNVCVYGPSGECVGTDAGGNFSLNLQPGHYQMEARVPAAYNMAAPPQQPVDILDGQVTNGITIQLLEVRMKGVLKKFDGTPIQGWVDVHSADWGVNYHAQAQDSDGAYALGGIPAGTYSAQPGANQDFTGIVPPDPIEVVIPASGTLTQDFVFTAATKTITGSVKRANGVAVPYACLNANKTTRQGWGNTQADANGNYTLSLTGGSWMVQVNPCSPDADWIYTGQPNQVDFLVDSSTQSTTLNFTVTTASVIVNGTIVDQAGAPITSGNIDLRNASGVGTNTQVQGNGTFSMRIVAGTYQVNFWNPQNMYTLPATSITVNDGETRTLALVARAKTAHIKGTVVTNTGLPAANVMMNAWEMKGPSEGPGSFGNARTAADGTYDMLVNAGTFNVGIGMEPNSQYILLTQGPQPQVTLETETSIVTGVNFTVVRADATITGSVLAGGQVQNNIPGCVFARPAGSFNENCSPVDQRTGTFTLKVSTLQSTTWDIGVHTPPNFPFSSPAPVRVTVTQNATVTQNIELIANNSTIGGRFFDSSGFPLKNCDKLKNGNVFADGNMSHYQGEIKADCSYRISLVAGVYNVGANFPPESGALNSPPGQPVQVFNGQTVEKNLQFIAADATVKVTLLNEAGVGTQGYIWADNSQEINQSREGMPGGQPGPAGGKRGADLGFGKKAPCDAKDFNGIKKCCSNVKNKQVCHDFKVPDGPKGCTNAWDCIQICKKSPSLCRDASQGNENTGPQPGEDFVGPGGCKSETECKTYCSKPEHQTECSNFKPPASAGTTVRISSVPKVVKISSVNSTATAKNAEGDAFKNIINSGGPTDMKGNATINLLSGHKYRVCAGLPPESNAMPPKCQDVDLTTAKNATVVLQLRKADATFSGKITLEKGTIDRCFVHAWAEDGSFSGQPCRTDGTYQFNATCNTTWHFGADMMKDNKMYRSPEVTTVVTCDVKKYTKNLALKEMDFTIPAPVTVSGSCADTLSLGLSNGVKLVVPGGAISSSTSGTCMITAEPTIELVSTQADQLEGVGYTIKALDENNAVVQKLNSSATVTMPYQIAKDKEGSSYESGLKAVFYDSTLGAYKKMDNCTKDETANTFQCSIDHFSAYAVANGSSANAILKTVTTSVKNGITSFTVNKKKVTPFASCKGQVSVVTKTVGGTQYIAATASCEGAVKIYSTKPKLVKTLKSGFTGVNTVVFADVTRDGSADIIVAPTNGTTLLIYQPGKKYKVLSAAVTGRATTLTASAIDFSSNGISSLVGGTVVNGNVTTIQVFKFAKNAFTATASTYNAFLTGVNGVITLNIPKATVTTISPTSISKSNKKASVIIKGTNFTPDSKVLVGTYGAKVTYMSSTQLKLTINATKLGKGSYTVKVTNPGGATTSAKTKLRVK